MHSILPPTPSPTALTLPLALQLLQEQNLELASRLGEMQAFISYQARGKGGREAGRRVDGD